VAPRRCGLAPSDTSENVDHRLSHCARLRRQKLRKPASPLRRRSQHPSPGRFPPKHEQSGQNTVSPAGSHSALRAHTAYDISRAGGQTREVNHTRRFLKRRRRFSIRRRVRFAIPRPCLPVLPFNREDQSFFTAVKSRLRRATRLRRAIKFVTGEAKPLSRPKTNASTLLRSPRTSFASPLPNIWATTPPYVRVDPVHGLRAAVFETTFSVHQV
jgi:hypothetical protein